MRRDTFSSVFTTKPRKQQEDATTDGLASGSSHPNSFTFDTVLPRVLSKTPAKAGVGFSFPGGLLCANKSNPSKFKHNVDGVTDTSWQSQNRQDFDGSAYKQIQQPQQEIRG
ncbi:hypothetical protein NQZ68_019076 [Dissostichus eleginoides]|nr:hypothetical protein NQZ68_019076 [Dissostichus eleginoides]